MTTLGVLALHVAAQTQAAPDMEKGWPVDVVCRIEDDSNTAIEHLGEVEADISLPLLPASKVRRALVEITKERRGQHMELTYFAFRKIDDEGSVMRVTFQDRLGVKGVDLGDLPVKPIVTGFFVHGRTGREAFLTCDPMNGGKMTCTDTNQNANMQIAVRMLPYERRIDVVGGSANLRIAFQNHSWTIGYLLDSETKTERGYTPTCLVRMTKASIYL